MTAAVKKELGDSRVAPPEDVAYSPLHDLLANAVYERKKKEAKKKTKTSKKYQLGRTLIQATRMRSR